MRVASIVLFTDRYDETCRFYGAVGLPLDHGAPGDGSAAAACDLDGTRVIVRPAEGGRVHHPWRSGGCTVIGLSVPDLTGAWEAVAAMGLPTLVPHRQDGDLCRTLVTDPDGRPVELVQVGHCSGPASSVADGPGPGARAEGVPDLVPAGGADGKEGQPG
jgi:hypothetical protein